MKYIHTSGAVIETNNIIRGEGWKEVKPKKKTVPKKRRTPKKVDTNE